MKSLFVITTLLLALLVSNTLFAQNYIIGLNDFIDYNNIKLTNSRSRNTYENIQGSPFLYGDFAVGTVKLNNGKYYKGELRFDNFRNELEFKNDKGEVLSVLSPQNINKVVLNDVTLDYIALPEKEGRFFRELLAGKYTLLQDDKVEYKDAEPARPYHDPQPAKFVKKNPEFFIWNPEIGLVQLKNKKSLEGLVPNQSKVIQKYLKNEKIRFSNEADLVKLVGFLNSLG